ncbi:Serine acetyltransferase [Gordonia rubripertincta]|nr:Serine acetyltransferase [Gordonia rubripertincta]
MRATLSTISSCSGIPGPYRRYRIALECDLTAYGLTAWRPWSRFRLPTLHYQRVLRATEYFRAREGVLSSVIAIVLYVRLKSIGKKLGLSIPPGVFGPGLSVPHYGSVVVNDKVRAGAFCRIHSATNLGESGGSAPVLGDGVYVGPGAVLYGGISVGSGSVVGANAVVNKDVAENSLVVGAPASVRPTGTAYVRSMPAHIIRALAAYEEAVNQSPCHSNGSDE